jgi:hypothetical protein
MELFSPIKSSVKKGYILFLEAISFLLSARHQYALYLPIVFIVSIYIPIGIELRSDFFILFGVFGLTVLGVIIKNKRLYIDKTIGLIIVIILLHFLSTAIFFYSGESRNAFFTFGSITEIQFWVRLILIIIICRNSHFTLDNFKKLFKHFYFVSVMIIVIGLLESLSLLPSFYDVMIDKLFASSKYNLMREGLLNAGVRRATSLLGSPSIYAHFSLLIFWLTLKMPKTFIPSRIKFLILGIILASGFASDSKIFYAGVIIVIFYEQLILKRNIAILIGIIIGFWLLALVVLNADKAMLPDFLYNIRSKIDLIRIHGFMNVFFSSRFDSKDGLLYDNLLMVKDNFFFGIGLLKINNLFFGDSFLITNLLKVGAVGLSVFLILVRILYRRLNTVYKETKDDVLRNVVLVLRNFLLLNLLFSIGINSFALTRTSDLIFFLMFMTIYVHKESKNKEPQILAID